MSLVSAAYTQDMYERSKLMHEIHEKRGPVDDMSPQQPMPIGIGKETLKDHEAARALVSKDAALLIQTTVPLLAAGSANSSPAVQLKDIETGASATVSFATKGDRRSPEPSRRREPIHEPAIGSKVVSPRFR